MPLLQRLGWIGFALGGAHLLVAVAMAAVPNPEGPLGGLFYAAFYAAPVTAIAFATRSSPKGVRSLGGWLALVTAALYCAIAVLNWPGYTEARALFTLAVTVPTVVFDLVVFSATIAGRAHART